VAYDANETEYAQFETKEEAEKWLTRWDDGDEGITMEAVEGDNIIAEIKWRSQVTVTDTKANYHVHTDECGEDCEEEEWPYCSDFNWVGKHEYVEVV
jgi:hypothetical protein